MSKLVQIAAVFSAILATTAATAMGAPGKITGTPGHGCPAGALCVYPTSTTWNTGPESKGEYYSYGYHNLHAQTGKHLVYNNQYAVNGNDAGATFCTGSNGTGGPSYEMFARGGYTDIDLTPFNSITLWLPGHSGYKSEFSCEM
jgi:hypothetical protein